MSHYHNNQMASASDSYSRKSELSGLKQRKIISGAFDGKSPYDYESAWSPTSPLDFRMLSTFANPFGGGSRSIRKRQQKSWDTEKVGLSIVDSLDVDSSRILLPSTDSKNIIFGSVMRSGNPKCPKPHHLNNPLFEHFPLFSHPFAKTPLHKEVDVVELNSPYSSRGVNPCQVMSGPTESEIEISEDYTCVISHGPNPKTTHIYGDLVESVEHKEINKDSCGEKKESIFEIAPFETPDELIPPNDFLSFCCLCNKKLALGKDIYMYRGYRAFCSDECRFEEILLDEEMMEEEEDEEEGDIASSSNKKSNGVFFTVG